MVLYSGIVFSCLRVIYCIDIVNDNDLRLACISLWFTTASVYTELVYNYHI